ncbi:hypothetical protein F5Y14DRAFT_372175 [Nemania sp. NC0429]|nr:hypothetical protein F5Y14DRAFT_372175 [Nemania sp. NC0429]
MKATIALSTLASLLPLVAQVSAMELPGSEKLNLLEAKCENVRLTGKYTLEVDCRDGSASLDLNSCFSNNLGALEYVQDGGFGATCEDCSVVKLDDRGRVVVGDNGKYSLNCVCGTGGALMGPFGAVSMMNTTYDISDWQTIRIAGPPAVEACQHKKCGIGMFCHGTEGLSKRAENGRFFTA